MTAFFTDAQMDAILDSYWGSGTPATWYVALFTVAPGVDGTGGTEAAYTGYSRVAVTNNATEWPAAAAGLKSNANALAYGVAGSGPTNVVAFGFYDHPTLATAVHLFAVVAITGAPVPINNGADVTVASGAIDLTRCA